MLSEETFQQEEMEATQDTQCTGAMIDSFFVGLIIGAGVVGIVWILCACF